MLIFGFGPGRARDEGAVVPATCPSCGNDVVLRHVVSKKAIRLYFVPVVPYGSDEYLLCPVCNRGMRLTGEQAPVVEAMKAATAAHAAGSLPTERYEAEVEQFWLRLGRRPAATPTADTGAGAGARPDMLADLERLHAEGVLDDDEFRSARRRLLGG